MAPQDPRPRSFTRPPSPPRDIDERVRDAEHAIGALERDHGDVASTLEKIKATVVDIQTQITIWTTERAAETKSSDRWKNWALGILATIVAASFIAFASFMRTVQVA